MKRKTQLLKTRVTTYIPILTPTIFSLQDSLPKKEIIWGEGKRERFARENRGTSTTVDLRPEQIHFLVMV